MNVSSTGRSPDLWSAVKPTSGVDPAAYALEAMQGADAAMAQTMGQIATGTVNGESVDCYA